MQEKKYIAGSTVLLNFLLSIIFYSGILAAADKKVPASGNGKINYQIHVNGNLQLKDGNGTAGKPFGTIEQAKNYIRSIRTAAKNNITVILEGSFRYGENPLHRQITTRKRDIMSGDGKTKIGTYEISTALKFDEKDCLLNHKITYLSANNKQAVISGGTKITGWKLHDAEKNIWKANVGPIEAARFARQLYINGRRGTRARSDNRPKGTSFKNSQVYFSDTLFSDPPAIGSLSDMQAMYFREWCSYMIGIKGISYDKGVRKFRIDHDEEPWKYITQTTSRQTNVNSADCLQYFENAYVLLDSPSEFFIDRRTGDVYYMPMDDEDMEKAVVQVPVVDELVNISGSGPETPACNIEFKDIVFECATWLRPNGVMGHIANQADTIRHEGSRLGEGAFTVANARNIDLSDCVFSNIGNIAVFYRQNIRDCDVTGCKVTRVSGNGIVMAEPVAGSGIPGNSNCSVTNNYIAGAGLEHPSAAGIVGGILANSRIANNEVVDSAYSGVSVGWHWGGEKAVKNNIISGNRILNTMTSGLGDGGGIYHLGATAGSSEVPGYIIRENYIFNQMNTYGVLYADNNSSWLVFDANVVDTHFADTNKVWSGFTQGNKTPANNIIFRNNFFTGGYILDGGYLGRRLTDDDKKGINKFINNTFNPDLPGPALDIIARSGLTAKYKSISDYRESLTTDPGFEFTRYGAAVLWQTENAKLFRTTAQKHSGTYSGLIMLEKPEGRIFQKLSPGKAKKYRVSLYVRTNGESGKATVSVIANNKETSIVSIKINGKAFTRITGELPGKSFYGKSEAFISLKFSGLKQNSAVFVDDFYVTTNAIP